MPEQREWFDGVVVKYPFAGSTHHHAPQPLASRPGFTAQKRLLFDKRFCFATLEVQGLVIAVLVVTFLFPSTE